MHGSSSSSIKAMSRVYNGCCLVQNAHLDAVALWRGGSSTENRTKMRKCRADDARGWRGGGGTGGGPRVVVVGVGGGLGSELGLILVLRGRGGRGVE